MKSKRERVKEFLDWRVKKRDENEGLGIINGRKTSKLWYGDEFYWRRANLIFSKKRCRKRKKETSC